MDSIDSFAMRRTALWVVLTSLAVSTLHAFTPRRGTVRRRWHPSVSAPIPPHRRQSRHSSTLVPDADDGTISTPRQAEFVGPLAKSQGRRRAALECLRAAATAVSIATLSQGVGSAAGFPEKRGALTLVVDPDTYSALAYAPPATSNGGLPPLLVVLHGAGKNDLDAWSLSDPTGEHAGLPPSLLSTRTAPPELADGFAVAAPYAAGKRSFYEEPRAKLLRFVEWFCSDAGRKGGCPAVDTNRIFLLGFSDGATVGLELATTRRFRGCILAALGFTGTLPPLALERLKNVPIWVFHSADDVIFPVEGSDRVVASLEQVSDQGVVRYTRYDRDQEGFTGSVRGHSTGITASRSREIYRWMLSIT